MPVSPEQERLMWLREQGFRYNFQPVNDWEREDHVFDTMAILQMDEETWQSIKASISPPEPWFWAPPGHEEAARRLLEEPFHNTPTTHLSPLAFREALTRLRAMRDEPTPVFDRLVLNPHLALDWSRITAEAPALGLAIEQSQAENAGDVILPVEVYEYLLARGLLVWVEEAALDIQPLDASETDVDDFFKRSV